MFYGDFSANKQHLDHGRPSFVYLGFWKRFDSTSFHGSFIFIIDYKRCACLPDAWYSLSQVNVRCFCTCDRTSPYRCYDVRNFYPGANEKKKTKFFQFFWRISRHVSFCSHGLPFVQIQPNRYEAWDLQWGSSNAFHCWDARGTGFYGRKWWQYLPAKLWGR